MKLHAVDRPLAMAHAHDGAVVRPRADFERVRNRIRDNEGVVTAGDEWLGDAAENAAAVVFHAGHLAMHQYRRADDVAAEGVTDRLVSEADAEHRDPRSITPDQFHANPGVLRATGAR